MDKKLVKEIITTETEKFTDDGTIKERIKEIREKVYADANAFSKEEIEKAEVKEGEEAKGKDKEEDAKPKEATQEELIAEASNKLDAEHQSTQAGQPQQQNNGYVPPPNTYNVLNRTMPSPMGPINNQVKFPWEK